MYFDGDDKNDLDEKKMLLSHLLQPNIVVEVYKEDKWSLFDRERIVPNTIYRWKNTNNNKWNWPELSLEDTMINGEFGFVLRKVHIHEIPENKIGYSEVIKTYNWPDEDQA